MSFELQTTQTTDKIDKTDKTKNYCFILFVGAGPSNISGAHYLHKNFPEIKFLIVDNGKNITKRDHNDSVDCVNGIGGAGLFSDGKFSWYPAGTQVWKLEKERLEKSYNFLKDILDPFVEENMLDNPTMPPIPDFPEFGEDFVSDEKWKLKSYGTHYLTLDQRKRLGIKMTIEYYDEKQFNSNNFFLLHNVIRWTKLEDNSYDVECQHIITNEITIINTFHIINGGGRFMPIYLKNLGVQTTFKRVELGVRFAGKSSSCVYHLSPNIDPKFMMFDKEKQIEYRSFCTCRDGENVVTNVLGIKTWSGRSDCEPTGESNFGFNLVFKDEKYLELLEHAKTTEPFDIPMREIYDLENPDVLNKIGNYKKVLEYIRNGLESFIEFTVEQSGISKEDFLDFRLRGPTIEGVGFYPVLTENLKIPNENIYVVGDATGIFRGIVASMLSGIYVSDLIAHQILCV